MGYKRKKIRDCETYSLFSQLTGKEFNFEREVIPRINLIVRLNEEQKLAKSCFLHRSGTKYLIFFLGKYYYRDWNFYFVYDKVFKQWFTSHTKFYNVAICKKITHPNFKLIEFMKNFSTLKKKEIVMLLVLVNKDKA